MDKTNYIEDRDIEDIKTSLESLGTENTSSIGLSALNISQNGLDNIKNYTQNISNTVKVFEKINNKDFNDLSQMIDNNFDIKYVDDKGHTILHKLAIYYKNIPNKEELLEKILKIKNINTIINNQDKTGNTAIHLGVMNDNHDLVDKFVSMGGDTTIRNNENFYVSTEDSNNSQSDESRDNSIFIKKNNSDSISRNASNIVSSFIISPTSSGVFMPPQELIVSNKKRFTQQSLGSASPKNLINIRKQFESQSSPSTTEYIENIVNKYTLNSEKIQKGGNNGELNEINNTSELIRNISIKASSHLTRSTLSDNLTSQNAGSILMGMRDLNTFSEYNLEQEGGSFVGMRDLNTFDEYNQNAGYSKGSRYLKKNSELLDFMSESSRGERSELGRLIARESSDIHDRVVKKIAEILDISEENAKIYKAALYNRVKNEQPELNNFDRAVEMEKLVTKENLEEIDFEKWKNLISSYRKEKPKKERKNKTNTPTTTISKTTLSPSSVSSKETDTETDTETEVKAKKTKKEKKETKTSKDKKKK
jgi:hypothetical protein